MKSIQYPEIANAQFQMTCPLAIQLARKVVQNLKTIGKKNYKKKITHE